MLIKVIPVWYLRLIDGDLSSRRPHINISVISLFYIQNRSFRKIPICVQNTFLFISGHHVLITVIPGWYFRPLTPFQFSIVSVIDKKISTWFKQRHRFKGIQKHNHTQSYV